MNDAAARLASDLERSGYAARLGLRIGDVMPDVVTASVPYVPGLANAQGFVHGGVAASLAVWPAMVLAVASDRGRAVDARPVSVNLSYVSAAHEEALYATARVSARGRDLVHVEVEIESERGRKVAAALAVLRTVERRAALPPRTATPAADHGGRRLISPFSQAMGIQLRGHDATTTSIAMPVEANEGLGGRIDPGAMLALADVCAALACLPSLDERMSGSATLSLAAVFGEALAAPALAVGEQVAEDGGVRSALIRIDAEAAAHRAHHPALTACVAYRFLSAESGS